MQRPNVQRPADGQNLNNGNKNGPNVSAPGNRGQANGSPAVNMNMNMNMGRSGTDEDEDEEWYQTGGRM